MATYRMDLELSFGFQFYAVWTFGLLCTSFLEYSKYIRAEDEVTGRAYKRTLARTSIQGVYAFVVIGVVRTFFDFAVVLLQENPEYKALANSIQEKAVGKV